MQTYFRIILPLVRPILAVSGLLVFVATIAEFLLASIFLTAGSKKTLAVGLYGLIDADRSNNLGVFAAGAADRGAGRAALHVPAAVHRRRHHRRRRRW